MAKYFHNKSGNQLIVRGITIENDSHYVIPENLVQSWGFDVNVLDYLISGQCKMSSDGTTLINDGALCVDFLKGNYQTDSENAQFTRIKLVPTGWTYDAIGIRFKISELNSLKILKDGVDDTSINKTIKFYDANNVELTSDLSTCVKTVVTVEPTWDYYLICGQVAQTVNEIFMDAIGVPDVPANMGGSKTFSQNLNLKKFSQLKTDGKAPKLLSYSATYHTNKFKFSFFHSVGLIEQIDIILELYKL